MCLLPDDQCINTGRPVAEVLKENHTNMQEPPAKNSMCAAFEEYEELPKTVPFNFTEDYVTWIS